MKWLLILLPFAFLATFFFYLLATITMSKTCFRQIGRAGILEGTKNRDLAEKSTSYHLSKTAMARTGEPVPPRILSGRPIKRKRPRPMSWYKLIMFS
jgi:hypothetical protein